jgi:hypothetical protein
MCHGQSSDDCSRNSMGQCKAEEPLPKSEVLKAMKLLWPSAVYQAPLSQEKDTDHAREISDEMWNMRKRIVAKARDQPAEDSACHHLGMHAKDFQLRDGDGELVFSKLFLSVNMLMCACTYGPNMDIYVYISHMHTYRENTYVHNTCLYVFLWPFYVHVCVSHIKRAHKYASKYACMHAYIVHMYGMEMGYKPSLMHVYIYIYTHTHTHTHTHTYSSFRRRLFSDTRTHTHTHTHMYPLILHAYAFDIWRHNGGIHLPKNT